MQGETLDSNSRVLAVISSELLMNFALDLFYERTRHQSGQMRLGPGFAFEQSWSASVTSSCPSDCELVALGRTTKETGCFCSVSFPTPCKRDHKGMSSQSWREREGAKAFATLPDKIGGVPHPEFVEALMGFPIGWSELEHSATPSSRKSRNSSASESSNP